MNGVSLALEGERVVAILTITDVAISTITIYNNTISHISSSSNTKT
jgi:hypothetical protein